MLVFEEGGKLETPEKNRQGKVWTKKKKNLNQQMTPGWNWTQAISVGDKHSYKVQNLPIDETIDIVFKNHFHFFFHLLLQMEYKNSH